MLTIGKIAKEAGVGVETIRFYERKGLIKQPKKLANQGFRSYQPEDAQKVRFIKRAQELGFTLKEVKDLLKLNSNRQATCEDVRVKAEAKRKEIEIKIADLKQMKDALVLMERACSLSPEMVACCKIEDCFEGKCS
jgi:MerR family mercuric resistance operon transcriptional regulator